MLLNNPKNEVFDLIAVALVMFVGAWCVVIGAEEKVGSCIVHRQVFILKKCTIQVPKFVIKSGAWICLGE